MRAISRALTAHSGLLTPLHLYTRSLFQSHLSPPSCTWFTSDGARRRSSTSIPCKESESEGLLLPNMDAKQLRVGFIGAGMMASALINGVIAAKVSYLQGGIRNSGVGFNSVTSGQGWQSRAGVLDLGHYRCVGRYEQKSLGNLLAQGSSHGLVDEAARWKGVLYTMLKEASGCEDLPTEMDQKKDLRVGFVGAGNMATAMMEGIIAGKMAKPENIMASDIYQPSLDRLSALGVQ
ncbi:unnamed protein product, partial [Choristocarpus tenellus]